MNQKAKLLIIIVTAAVLAGIVLFVVLSRSDEATPKPVVKTEKLSPPTEVLQQGEKASVVLDTSEGSFTIELDTRRAPKTANNFAYLAEQGFYDGLGFHRIVPDFVIQGGDPLGDGTGGPGYKVVEPPPANLVYDTGTVAMAKSGNEKPGTSGSQFFVITGSGAGFLPPEYALVGRVSEGLDTVERIGSLGAEDEQPTKIVVIEKATLERS